MTSAPSSPKLPEPATVTDSLTVAAWTEKQTMAAVKATASFGSVKLTNEYGPYDIDRPTLKCDLLVEAIITARDSQWQSALLAQAAEKDAEIARLRADAERLDWVIAHRNHRVQGSAEKGWSVLDCSNGLTFIARRNRLRIPSTGTAGGKVMSVETPEQRARRLGVPFAKPRGEQRHYEHNPIVAVCGLCGRDVYRIEGVSCSQSRCPIQPKAY